MSGFQRFSRVLASSVVVVAAALAAAGSASATGHCALVQGSASYSPTLDLSSSPTTMTISATGSGCVGVSLDDASGLPTVAVGATEISGTFTGNGSTLLSDYSGTGTVTYHLVGGGTEVDHFSATCVAGALGVCPLLGTVTSSTGDRLGATVEMTPQTLTLNPLGSYSTINYVELAFTYEDYLAYLGRKWEVL
jgi:hypothetical protein